MSHLTAKQSDEGHKYNNNKRHTKEIKNKIIS